MSNMNIPSARPMPRVGSKNYEEELMKAQEHNAQRNLLIQAMMSDQSEKRATRSNMQKSAHDAMMSVINNFKS